MKKVIVIGGGLGGLSSAIHLANQGYNVTIVEKEATLGGKLQRVETNGFTFDLGPSTITMKHVFESVIEACGREVEDYLQFYPIETGTRNVFPDGYSVDFNTSIDDVEQQIHVYSPEDALQYRSFLEE
ncbi:FAD-dependent oxidoreductase [Aquibacillus koreensis]|uniref:FAD-dependent oxidoreductase n=1 Tax=Aquibacillus koreensis TaxID=279446 RepID=A0A9X3WL23_9BACI|nr:FAD-dependent oxidoreductase [Aquibacillus koreensis]MCT2536142.1 FAD-dependent oxidoreductase [Aquibacillus koreensis]MDC3422067.1 FAD-dependent oxidoreductase [Aquibacillus koreensis]